MMTVTAIVLALHASVVSAQLGGHLPEVSNTNAPLWANLLANGWPWQENAGQGILEALGQVDANGWPTVDARIGFMNWSRADSTIVGAATLTFNGQATLSLDGTGSITGQSYDAPTNTTTAYVNIGSPGTSNYILHFANAWRKADHTADETGNTRGITNARLMAPGHVWGTDYWYKDAVSLHNVLTVVQFEWPQGPGNGNEWSCNGSLTGVMGSCDTTWSTRAKPRHYGYSYRGIPFEEIVLFANLVDVDVYVHAPIGADNDYITKMAQVFRYGSDGVNPYTTDTHDPATWTPNSTWYPGLEAGRHVYVEFTNELFSYYGYGDPQAQAEIAAGDPHHLNWDTQGGGDRWNAWNVVRIGLLWRQVWGDAAMQNTVRMVYAGQGDWGNWGRHQYGMDYISYVWGASSPWDTIDGFTNPRQPVSYYLYAVAGSFYVHCNNTAYTPNETTVDQFFTNVNTSLSVNGGLPGFEGNSVYQRHGFAETMATTYGIKFVAYETGLEIFEFGAVGAAWSDARMRTLYYDLLHHAVIQPHADAIIQSATVRGANPGNVLSLSYGAAYGYPWARDGTPTIPQVWLAVQDVAAELGGAPAESTQRFNAGIVWRFHQ